MPFWDIVLQQPRFWLGLTGSMILLAGIAYFGLTDASNDPAGSRFAVSADNPPIDPGQVVNPGQPFDDVRDIRRKLVIAYQNWHIPESTTILLADFVLSNASDYDLKGATIRCTLFAPGLLSLGETETTAPGVLRNHSTIHLDSVRLASGIRAVERLECRVAGYSVIRRPGAPDPVQ